MYPKLVPLYYGFSLSSVTDDGPFVFQARNIKTGELAAVKIIKLEPGKCSHPPCRWLNRENATSLLVFQMSIAVRVERASTNNDKLL